MARPNLVKTLERKYARLLGQHRATPSPDIRAALAHIEAVIHMFEASWDSASVKPVEPRGSIQWGKRGIGVRLAAKVLREADSPLSPTEIARAAYEASGLPMPSERAITLSGADLIWSLRRYFGNRLGVIDGRPRRYRLMPRVANTPPIPGLPARP